MAYILNNFDPLTARKLSY